MKRRSAAIDFSNQSFRGILYNVNDLFTIIFDSSNCTREMHNWHIEESSSWVRAQLFLARSKKLTRIRNRNAWRADRKWNERNPMIKRSVRNWNPPWKHKERVGTISNELDIKRVELSLSITLTEARNRMNRRVRERSGWRFYLTMPFILFPLFSVTFVAGQIGYFQ